MSKNKKDQSVIRIELSGERTCEFFYSDPIMAKEQFLQLSSQGVICGQIIKSANLIVSSNETLKAV